MWNTYIKTLLFLFLSVFSAGVKAQELYGTTQLGGIEDVGTIFKYNGSTNTITALHSMSSTAGALPFRNDLQAYNGKLYGMTTQGGVNSLGIIFEFDPATNILTKKIDFNGAGNGSLPNGSLTLYGSKFYGMTNSGGINDRGVIFEYDPTTNVITRKISLSNANGSYPKGSLTLYGSKFYGMTSLGGANSRGVIFEYDPATNTYTRKISFNTNGRNPQGNLTVSGSKLYGMTELGGTNNAGVIFEWDPANNVYTKKIDMSIANGSYPKGSFTLSGSNLYAMASEGGTSGAGVIFEWNPATNAYARKYSFDGTNGSSSNPQGNLVLSGGVFYGMTGNGGTNILGTIFEWNPASNAFSKKIDFDGTNKGSDPAGSLTLVAGTFYGLSYTGGAGNNGTLFEWNPASNTFTKKVDLGSAANGKTPGSGLTMVDDKFYGVGYEGGLYNQGVIFEWEPVTNTYTKKYDFDGTNGAYPSGNLTLANGKLYGMTPNGGTNGLGVIYEFNPATNLYTNVYNFSFASGYYAVGSLAYYNGKLYGTAAMGASSMGVLFELDPTTNSFTKKYEFDYVNGSNPQGELVLYNDKFYGLTSLGGIPNMGVLFEWNPATNVLTKLIEFNGTANGSEPRGSLTLYNDKLYGMTYYGGTSNLGTIFEFDPATNTLAKKINMTATNGSYPSGKLTVSGGKLYATTSGGGTSSMGVLFEWNATTDVYTKKVDFNGTNGSQAYLTNLVEFTPTPLPVSLINFSGKRLNSKQVLLKWKTASETNNKGFDIEASDNNKTFRKIDFVAGQGNSSKIINYELPITNAKEAYYRLKQTDFDGKFVYSESVFVRTTEQPLTWNVFPNPSKGFINLQMNDFINEGKYFIFNALGQEIKAGICTKETTLLDLSKEPNGIYWLKIIDLGEVFSQKFIISR